MTLIPDLGDFFIPNLGDFIGPIVVVFVLAAVIALVVTPVVRAVVLRYGIVDHPEAASRQHDRRPARRRARGRAPRSSSSPAVFLILNQNAHFVPVPFSLDSSEAVALLLGGALAAVLGAIDDLFDLRARWQLLGQVALACVAVFLGVVDHLRRQSVRRRTTSTSTGWSRPPSPSSGSSA